MKVLLGIWLFTVLLMGQESLINWYTPEEAVKLSQDSNKSIMIVVYSESCPYCLGYFNLLKSNKQLRNSVNNSVYQVAIHQKDTTKLGLGIIKSTPSFLFFNSKLDECANPQYGIPVKINVLIDKINKNCK